MDVKHLTDKLTALKLRVSKAKQHEVAIIAANEAVRLFKENFQNEAFFGDKWSEVKRRKPPKQKGAAGKRKILTGATGNLGRSIKYVTAGTEALIYSDAKYASAHNYGTNNAGRKRNVKIPQRQFIGMHKKLNEAIMAKTNLKIKAISKL